MRFSTINLSCHAKIALWSVQLLIGAVGETPKRAIGCLWFRGTRRAFFLGWSMQSPAGAEDLGAESARGTHSSSAPACWQVAAVLEHIASKKHLV